MRDLRNKLIRLAHSVPETRPHLLPLLRQASDDFHTRVEEMAQKLGRWFVQTVPNGGPEDYAKAHFYVEPRGPDKYLIETAGQLASYKPDSKAKISDFTVYVQSAARDLKIRLEKLGSGRFALTDGMVASKPLVLKGLVQKLRALITKAGFEPYESWTAMSVHGPYGKSSGHYTLEPSFKKDYYTLRVYLQSAEQGIDRIARAEAQKLGLDLKVIRVGDYELRLP